jgi:hypothetical protein
MPDGLFNTVIAAPAIGIILPAFLKMFALTL